MTVSFDSFRGVWRSSNARGNFKNGGFSSRSAAVAADKQGKSKREGASSRSRSKQQNIRDAARRRREEKERRQREAERKRQQDAARKQRLAAERRQLEERRRQEGRSDRLRAEAIARQDALRNQLLAEQRRLSEQFLGGGGAGGGGGGGFQGAPLEDSLAQTLASIQNKEGQDFAQQRQAFIEANLPEAERQITQALVGRGLGGAEQAKALGTLGGELATQAGKFAGSEKRADIASLLAQFGGVGGELAGRRSLAQQESQFSRNLAQRQLESLQDQLIKQQQVTSNLFGGSFGGGF